MNIIQKQSRGRLGLAALACLALGGGLFGLGYWQGERAESNALAARGGSAGASLAGHGAIPANASPEMKEFLQNQATLADKMEQARKQAPHGVLDPVAFAQFRQQNADLLKRQNQLAVILAQQQAKNTVAAPRPAVKRAPVA